MCVYIYILSSTINLHNKKINKYKKTHPNSILHNTQNK